MFSMATDRFNNGATGMITVRMSAPLAQEIAKTLTYQADMLRRRHPSDGLFQNAYTSAECDAFKEKATRYEGVVRQITDSTMEADR